MSAQTAIAAPATVHSGVFVQSRLPILLHKAISPGVLSLHNIGMVEAAIIGVAIYWAARGRNAPAMMRSEVLIAGGTGSLLYHIAPP